MDSLSSNMKNISSLIGKLSGVLGSKRSDITQLGSSYKVISSLEFIFDLPHMMQVGFKSNIFRKLVQLLLNIFKSNEGQSCHKSFAIHPRVYFLHLMKVFPRSEYI